MRWLVEFIGTEATPKKIADIGWHWRAERFSLLADQAPAAWQEHIRDVLAGAGDVRRPDESHVQHAVWVGPTSPRNAEELTALGPEGVAGFLRDWVPTPGHFGSTPEGLGRVLVDVIGRDAPGYVAHAERFRDLDPTYVRSFFSGLEATLRAKVAFAWHSVLELGYWVVGRPREMPGRRKELMEADPDWAWTRGALARLLEVGLEGEQIGFDERVLVWSILSVLTTDLDPTPEHEEKYGDGNMDPSTMAINTVRGKAFHAVIEYALWVHRHLDHLAQRPPVTFDVMPGVRQVLDEHLNVARDPYFAIRSVYGQYFPWLHLLDAEWARANVERIFPADPQYFSAAWASYVRFCAPYAAVLGVLRAAYARAITGLPRYDPNAKCPQDAPYHGGEHLMASYWQGTISLDDSLLVDFFRLAPEEMRSRIIEYIGQSAAHWEKVEPVVLDRLRALWEWRLRTAQESGDLGAYRRELSKFGWWFASKQFTAAWSMQQLRIVLDATGLVDPDFMVYETLAALAPTFPLDAVLCVRRMVEGGGRQDWAIGGNREHIRSILKAAPGSEELEAKAVAARLIEYLVGRGHFDYRQLLS